MPSLCAASITVLPGGTCTGLPSISMFSIALLHVGRHHALLVVDVVLEFVAEMLDEALHRQRRGLAERADRAPGDVVRDRRQQIEILVASLAVLDAVDHAPQPPGALAAGRALAAGLLVIEIR